jgi:hypothetical protein
MTLYIVRLNQTHHKWVDSRPCCDCYIKLSKLYLKRIVYSTNDGFESIKLKDYQPVNMSEGNEYYNSLNI